MSTILEQTFDLRALALGCYHLLQESQAQREQDISNKQTDETRATFQKWFGAEPDRVDGRHVYSGDVQLSFRPASYSFDFGTQHEGWYVWGQCKHCGQDALSPWCGDLETIGRYLDDFQVDWSHSCAKPAATPAEPTVEEKLLSVLREFIESIIAARADGI